LSPLFVDYIGVQGEVLDVGCGTGALTFAIGKSQAVCKIVAVELSDVFSLSTVKDGRSSHYFQFGDAQSLRF
jgi:tRNA1(Val) A37 N6-methylase TrmN6